MLGTPLMKLFAHILPALLLSATITAGAESIGGKEPPRAARSVHLQWTAPESAAFYLEMTIERSTPGSYFMACGWSGGYFGLQELRDGKKVAIFSVWDPTTGDDPNAVTPEQRVELLHQGAGARIRRFGGEGTGGQCMIDFPWELGGATRFLLRAETHGTQAEKSAYSGWIFDPAAKEWRHLVTFRTRNSGKLLRGLYSFVEDFRRDGKSVGEARRASFGRGWVRSPAGEWAALTGARFTASRATWEARDNIDAGLGGAGYFLASGGDTVRAHELGAALPTLPRAERVPDDWPATVFTSSAAAVPLR